MAPTTLAQHLDRMLHELEEQNAAAEAVARELTPAQLAWRPEPGRWSIEQCLEHLAVTNARYRAKIEEALGAGGLAPGAGSSALAAAYRPRFLARMIRDTPGPVVKRKLKTPRVFAPGEQPAPGALDRFLEEQRRLATFIDRARALDPRRVRFSSPVSGLIRVNLPEALELIVVHEQRHLRQAEAVRRARGFPA